jgi:hypothetical protein
MSTNTTLNDYFRNGQRADKQRQQSHSEEIFFAELTWLQLHHLAYLLKDGALTYERVLEASNNKKQALVTEE